MTTTKQLLKLKKQIIAIDLDRTLTTTKDPCWHKTTYGQAKEFYLNKVKVNKKMKNLVNKLSVNNKIFIYTSRDDYYMEVTEKWLAKNHILYDWLMMKKPIYDLFIDDKVLNVRDLK